MNLAVYGIGIEHFLRCVAAAHLFLLEYEIRISENVEEIIDIITIKQ